MRILERLLLWLASECQYWANRCAFRRIAKSPSALARSLNRALLREYNEHGRDVIEDALSPLFEDYAPPVSAYRRPPDPRWFKVDRRLLFCQCGRTGYLVRGAEHQAPIVWECVHCGCPPEGCERQSLDYINFKIGIEFGGVLLSDGPFYGESVP